MLALVALHVLEGQPLGLNLWGDVHEQFWAVHHRFELDHVVGREAHVCEAMGDDQWAIAAYLGRGAIEGLAP